MYDDDHQIYTYDNDAQKAAQTLRRQTETVPQCYKEKLLQANPQKYQILTIDPWKPLGMRSSSSNLFNHISHMSTNNSF